MFPKGFELVYDNYNALAIALSPTESVKDIVLSIAVYPRWVSLFLMGGPKLPDPEKRLRGSGTTVRHIVLDGAATLDEPAVRALIAAAVKRARAPFTRTAKRRVVIKSVSPEQRPRRPATKPPPRAPRKRAAPQRRKR